MCIKGKLLYLIVIFAAASATCVLRAESGMEQHLEIRFESDLFAKRGQARISHADVDAHMSRIPPEHQPLFLSDFDRIGQMLGNLLQTRALHLEAIEAGLLEDSETLALLYQSASVFLAERHMQKYLAERELDDYEQLAREIYLTDRLGFRTEPSYDFTHLLIMAGNQRTEFDAAMVIAGVQEKLREGGEDFDALVERYSEDPSKPDNNGRFQETPLDQLDENFANALRLMQPGQFSEPVRSQFGWHIIRLDAINEPRRLEWEEAREGAIQRARRQHRRTLTEAYFRRIREPELEIAEGAVARLLDRYPYDPETMPSSRELLEQIQQRASQ